MKNSSKILIGVGFGALIGGIAGYYLNSDEGKKMQKQLRKQAAKARKQMGEAIETSKDEVIHKMNEITDYTKGKVGEIKTALHDRFESVIDTSEDVAAEFKSKFEHGVERARAKVKEQAEKVRNTENNVI